MSFKLEVMHVLCYFRKLDSFAKYKLLNLYCTSFFGCELWSLSIESVRPRGGFSSPAALGNNRNCRPPPTTHRRRMRSGVLVGEVVMGRSRCRRGRQYGDEWQRQHGGGKLKPQFNGRQSVSFSGSARKNADFYFFLKKFAAP
jgi:hypothetical protein